MIAVVGLIAWVIIRFPMPPPMRTVIIAVAVLIVIILVVRAFGTPACPRSAPAEHSGRGHVGIPDHHRGGR